MRPDVGEQIWTRVGRWHICYVIFGITTHRRPFLLVLAPTALFRQKLDETFLHI